MTLRYKHIYILSFENSSVRSPVTVKTGAYPSKMFQHAPLFAFMNMPINAVLKKVYSHSYPLFQVHTFQATMGFDNLFT